MFIKGLHTALRGIRGSSEFQLPDFSATKELAVFTDFSDRSGPWRTYSFLCCPSEAAEDLCVKLAAIRAEFGVQDGRRFEYKSMKDKKRWQAIQPWLAAFDSLPGVAFALLMRSDVISALKANAPSEQEELLKFAKETGLGDWSMTSSGGPILEEAMRVVHSVSYLHAALTKGKAPLHWYCDNDEILAGDVRRSAIHRYLPMVTEKYCRARVPSNLTTEDSMNGSPLRDFLSIPDLLSACVLEHQRGTESQAKNMIAKAAVVGDWMREIRKLQKVALRVTAHESGKLWWQLYRPSFLAIEAAAHVDALQ